MASKQQGTKFAGVTFRKNGTDKIFYNLVIYDPQKGIQKIPASELAKH